MKTIQLSLQVADDITSINQLDQYVDHFGQQIKRQLFTNIWLNSVNLKASRIQPHQPVPTVKKQRLWLGATDLES